MTFRAIQSNPSYDMLLMSSQRSFMPKQGNSVARDLPPTGSEANTTIVVFLYILDIDSHCPYLLLFFKTKIYFVIPRIIFSRDVGNSIKCKKNITPPPQTTPTFDMFEIKSEHGNRGLYWIYRFPLSPVSTIWEKPPPI